jgi:tetratricopeptide (TPR) repeat protein
MGGMALLAASIFCGSAQAYNGDVETAIISKDYEQARQAARRLLDQGPTEDQRQELRYYVGLCDLHLGEYAQARKIFNELIRDKRNIQLRDKAYLGLFDVYYIDGQYKKALKTVNRLLQLSPESEFLSLIYLKLARANLKLAQWQKARAYLTKIITEYPDSFEVRIAKQLLNEEQYFAVQVGAFLDRGRAEHLTLELQQKGEYAYIVETTDQDNRTFYRVRVGQLVLLNKAQKLETKLSQQGYPTQIYP